MSTAENDVQLIQPPKSTDRKSIEQLGYISSFDGIVGKDYAYVIYKEEDTRKGEWKLKVKGNLTADTSIDPDHPGVRRRIAEAAKSGKDYFVMGFNMTPRDGDPRLVENRIFFDETMTPTFMQLHLVTRNADGSPTEEKFVRVDWPGR